MADETQRTLGRIEGKLDALAVESARTHKRLDSHSDRLSSVERGNARRAGWAAAIAGVVALSSTKIKEVLFG